MQMPALFVSHGAPDLPLSDAPARRFLEGLAGDLPRPDAILVVSAHWETELPTVSTADHPETIYDFGGFAPELRQIRYEAPGAPDIARRAAGLLRAAAIPCEQDPSRGLDHGAWVPLLMVRPQADIPVFQLSVQPRRDPHWHYAVGRALAPLRDQGVMILASGSFTHDLRSYFPLMRDGENPPEPEWVTRFADWMVARLEAGDLAALLDYRAQAPEAVRNHPTDEHLLPLYVALGAAHGAPASSLHASSDRGVLRMDAFSFGEAA
jgi:4,5-DOPA dioxygenase extradiol